MDLLRWFLLFLFSLFWIYLAGRYWTKGQIKSLREDTTNQEKQEEANGEEE